MSRSSHPDTYFAATALGDVEHPRLRGEVSCDVCVIGGGFTSVNVALRKKLNLFGAVRPIRSIEGVKTRYIDFQGEDYLYVVNLLKDTTDCYLAGNRHSGRDLILGGVHVPHSMGPMAHSDGDVALHALMDAILGAASMGDIGNLFPDTDPKYKDAIEKTELGNLSQLEYAKELGISYSGAKSRVQRAKSQLKQLFVTCCEVGNPCQPNRKISDSCDC